MSSLSVLQSLIERIQNVGVKSVFGDPIETQGKTIIPVAKVGYGFGGGAGPGATSESDDDSDRDDDGQRRPKRQEEGVGGGGGVGVKPVGVVEVTPEATRIIPFGEGRRLLAAGVIGLLVGLLLGKWRGRKER